MSQDFHFQQRFFHAQRSISGLAGHVKAFACRAAKATYRASAVGARRAAASCIGAALEAAQDARQRRRGASLSLHATPFATRDY